MIGNRLCTCARTNSTRRFHLASRWSQRKNVISTEIVGACQLELKKIWALQRASSSRWFDMRSSWYATDVNSRFFYALHSPTGFLFHKYPSLSWLVLTFSFFAWTFLNHHSGFVLFTPLKISNRFLFLLKFNSFMRSHTSDPNTFILALLCGVYLPMFTCTKKASRYSGLANSNTVWLLCSISTGW